ncbi:protein PERCC1 [Pleurodeles waltl]|uniref:protein PERCC1 n=1 Tax=Pleurodeles waltl TaxID=8319 RepID=UPI0037094A97
MAAGVIQTMSEFLLLPAAFQRPYLPTSIEAMKLDFQETSDEEEQDEEDEEEEEEMEDEVSDDSSVSLEMAIGKASPELSDADMTSQLLHFSDLISRDIQRYFGRKSKEDDPDSCNIYEDYLSPAKSGREMYYADLVRIAQNGGCDDGPYSPLSPPVEINHQILKSICSQDGPRTLGPLAELFEVGLRRYTRQRVAQGQDNKRPRVARKYEHLIPMHKRQLPLSFWKEPTPAPPCLLNTSAPDFSDLLANWTSESGQEMQQASRDLANELSRQALEEDQFS